MTSDSHPPGGGRRRFFDFSSLLDALHRLYLQIGGRLLSRRMQPYDYDATDRDADIEGKLGRRLTDVAAQVEEAEAGETRNGAGPDRNGASSPRPAAKPKSGLLDGLRDRLGRGLRRRSAGRSQPHLSEKMQASTWEHINKAQLLARQGKLESARMHAGLAENAMQTAGRYMGDEEYAVFKTDVEARIQAIEVK